MAAMCKSLSIFASGICYVFVDDGQSAADYCGFVTSMEEKSAIESFVAMYIEQIYGDVNKAEKALQWKAELGLNEMMSSAWEWEKYIKQYPL